MLLGLLMYRELREAVVIAERVSDDCDQDRLVAEPGEDSGWELWEDVGSPVG